MLAGVCEFAPKPSMQLRPSHHAEDIGARFGEPSSFRELTSTTGVPKYRMAGSMVECMSRLVVVSRWLASRHSGYHPTRRPRFPNRAPSRSSADPSTALGTTTLVIPSERSESRDLHFEPRYGSL